jgi:4-carboxymuconolactone decarboxylase
MISKQRTGFNMLKLKKFLLLSMLTSWSASAAETSEKTATAATTENVAERQVISRADTFTVNQGPAAQFSGNVNFSRFPVMPSVGAVAPAIVRFEAGAHSNWHSHPHGQYLIVIEGEGRTQQWGDPVQVIRTGDVVWCPPDVKHWHGAAAHSAMAHIAISPVSTDNKAVSWLEPVVLTKAEQPSAKAATAVVLTEKQLAILPIAAVNATGDLARLKPALQQGLAAGLTVNEIKEVLSHQYAYVGFPRSLNGLASFKVLLEERKKAGITDPMGVDATVLPKNTDYYQSGTATMQLLTQQSASRPLFDFAPVMDHALKAHLFGYLFSRDSLSYIDRELVTIATLAAVGNVNSQLQSHYKVAMNIGLNQSQLLRMIEVLKQQVSAEMAANAKSALEQLELKQPEASQ